MSSAIVKTNIWLVDWHTIAKVTGVTAIEAPDDWTAAQVMEEAKRLHKEGIAIEDITNIDDTAKRLQIVGQPMRLCSTIQTIGLTPEEEGAE